MKLKYYLSSLAIAAALFTNIAWASNNEERQAKALADYQQHVQNMQSGMAMKAIVIAARKAFIESSAYNPYAGPEVALQSSLKEAFETNNWQQCLQLSKQILDYSYVSLLGHYAALACNNNLGNKEVAEFHNIIVDQIIDAIVDGNDGFSPESPFKTHSTPELYIFLNLLGLSVTEQDLKQHNGRVFDAMTVYGEGIPKESAVTLYFDITPQFKRGFGDTKQGNKD